MNTIQNIPYVEAKFDKNGEATNTVIIPTGTSGARTYRLMEPE